jgi:hypothetical protein
MTSKRKTATPVDPAPAEPRAAFAERPPSQSWERLSLPQCPQNYVWAWFKPATAPHGLIVRIPDETYRDHPELAARWTMRKFLQAAAIEPAAVAAWLLNGVSIPGMNGTNPYLDAPIPAPIAGMSPDIVVYVQSAPVLNGPIGGPIGGPPMVNAPLGAMAPVAHVTPYINGAPVMGVPPMVPVMGGPLAMGGVAMGGVPMGMNGVPLMNGPPNFNAPHAAGLPVGLGVTPADGAQPGQPLDAATLDIYERIEADWNSSNEIEKDLTRLRKQLVDILGRLKSLNRELSGPERVHSNSQDRKDWQDARRGLRDASNRVWKYLKAHDIGDTSNAGKRVAFEEIYRKQIAPRKPFKEFMATARAFESHRKTITQLHGDMSNAYSFASLDGERKAQQVLNRIQTKVREASNKKNFLGVILDS